MAEPTLRVVAPSVIHIGAYRSHTVLFIQLRHKTPRAQSDDLDVRWVRPTRRNGRMIDVI